MRKTSTLMLAALILVMAFCHAVFADEDYLTEYQTAVSNYYGVSLDEIQMGIDAGILDEELPVLFYIATEANVSPQSIAASREQGRSWQTIAEAHGLTAADFYVHVTDHVQGTKFNQILTKFEGLMRNEFAYVELTDDEVTALANLRFLYRHYNYSQRLIMNWAGEGKSFTQINHEVYAVTTQMRNQNLAGTN